MVQPRDPGQGSLLLPANPPTALCHLPVRCLVSKEVPKARSVGDSRAGQAQPSRAAPEGPLPSVHSRALGL